MTATSRAYNSSRYDPLSTIVALALTENLDVVADEILRFELSGTTARVNRN